VTDEVRSALRDALGGTYVLERELTGGGMSRVFLATETALGRKVVVKVLPREMSGQLSVGRFKREIALAAQLQHPHIVPLLTAGEVGDLPYFTMPFIKGESLRARLVKEGELPVAEAVRILREVASALDYAHEADVVHRDIKPDNVLLSGGSAMVTDFGVAKALSASATQGGGQITSLGVAIGTPAYMAPEQASADPMVDHRADVYAWGVLAYEVLTGNPPFAGRSAAALLAAHVTEAPEPVTRRRPSIPPALGALVMRCLEKRPADRPQSAAEVVRALDVVTTPSGGIAPTSSGIPAAPAPRGGGRRAWITAAVIVVAAGSVFAWQRLHRGPGAGGPPRSLAVLPFDNASGDSTQQYFAEGMTDDIHSALANAGVRVAARTSSYALGEQHATPQKVRATLGVDAVLTGRVSRLGDRLHVTADLINASDGTPIWSGTLDRQTKDIFSVQRAIIDSIVAALRVRLRDQPMASPAAAGDPALHDMVMEARYLSNTFTMVGIGRAIDLFDEVLARNPSNAEAHLGKALALMQQADGYAPPIRVYPQAEAEARKVLATDSSNSDAWSMAASITGQYVWDWPRSRAEAARALALNPEDALAGMSDSWFLLAHGQIDSALVLQRRALEVDPLSALQLFLMQLDMIAKGQYDSAYAYAQRIDSLYPGFAYLDDMGGYELALLGRWDEAERSFRASESRLGHRSPGLAWLLATRGRNAEARAVLADIERDWDSHYVAPEFVACAYAALGDRDTAFRWLDRGLDVHSVAAPFMVWFPGAEPLRDDPRFREVLKRLNLDTPP
jgi:TolB-like protein/tetratricopeptide (TPR) repeat protein/tRNA A-37 threonylcarbamoyl transferase component Bud32